MTSLSFEIVLIMFSLSLTAGKSAGKLVPVLVYANLFKTVVYSLRNSLAVFDSYHPERDSNVLKYRSVIKKVKILEYVAYAGIPDLVDPVA